MSKKDLPDPDNPFLAIDKSLFAPQPANGKRQGREQSYTKNRDLKKALKGVRVPQTAGENDDSQYFSDLMNMGGVEKLKASPKVNLSLPDQAAPQPEPEEWPPEWQAAIFEEQEAAKPARQIQHKQEAPRPNQAAQTDQAGPAGVDNSFGSMAGLLADIKVKQEPQPEQDDKGHDHEQEDKMLKEYLASAKNRPGGRERALKNSPSAREKTAPNTAGLQRAAGAADPAELEDDFSLAMREVAPLSGKGREVVPEPPKPNPAISPSNPLQDFIDGKVEFSLEFTEEFIEGHVLGLDPAIMGKLRAGSYSYEAHLDLHGLNSAQAFDNLVAFIKQSYMTGKRTVLVIPGRGKNSPDGSGILRSKLEEWLPQEPFKRVVLAFCTALPKHGGPGAIYVMLRKFKKSRGKIRWDHLPSDPDLFI